MVVTPLIPTHRRQRQANPSLQNEFQEGYTEKPCPQNKTKQKTKRGNKTNKFMKDLSINFLRKHYHMKVKVS